MTNQELLLIVMGFGGVAGLAYLYGQRRGATDRATDRPRDDVAPEASPPPAEKPKRDAAYAKLSYDEDDELDVTKLGKSGASARANARTVYHPPVTRIVYDEEAEADEPTAATSMFLVHATAQTDKGLRRKRNEDSLLVQPSGGLFVVADGMGGYRGGELASKLAVKTIGEAVAEQSFEGPPHDGIPREASELARAIQMANAEILETASEKPELDGMGTTVCAARFSTKKSATAAATDFATASWPR